MKNSLREYDPILFKRDIIAALTLFVMLIPQGMAYAMLAGLPPVMGLYAATVPLFVYALVGSSKHLSIGPVAITSLLVFSGVSVYADPGSSAYITYAIVLAFMVGVLQLLFGLFKWGFIVKFIPYSVLNGYTSAAAIVIGISQLNHLLGMDTGNYLQVHLLLFQVFSRINEIHLLTLAVGLGSILLLIIVKKFTPKLPNALVAVFLSTIVVASFRLEERQLQVIGDVPSGFPGFFVPELTIETVMMLTPMALTIALLGFMESLSIGKAIAKKENYEINPNREFTALGLSNIVGSFFSSFPVNGSFSRTAVNHQAGGATQLTAIMTGIFVLITVAFFTSAFYYIPNAALAAIIIVAVYKLVDIPEMKRLFRVKRFEGWIWVTTFITTLFIGIQWGIIVGAIFTLLLIIRKSAKPEIVQLGYVEREKTFRDISRYPEAITAKKVRVLRIDSSLHFANVAFLDEKLKRLNDLEEAEWLILDMSGVNDIDSVSIQRLEEVIEYFRKQQITMLFSNMKGSIRDTVNKVGWKEKYSEQCNHLTLEQLLREKGLRSYFDPAFNYISSSKEWVQDYII
ncbi:SulP family inorganic anion transporter [Halalkalibacter hemicellulosilyticus]|uniref:Sulfate permease n=1 Tax=Halalkalibacter hemicellulosilyticusJCM 9152 TaxID=1236971 RepID=W4Q9Z5_9BACI|nr:sulfate permease [Halalkalibacter hemicellulosilyticus]GAE28830.1 sulfate permease [Halalkalibacter hemicellulosilyticusJCM 9152]